MDQRLVQTPTTVYVVDDDSAVRRALAFTLDLAGFAVETFETGEALLLRDPLHGLGCLVLDERLPGVSGLGALRQLRARGVDLPALLVTSHPKPAVREAAAIAGVPIIEKPLEGETLVSAIHQLLDDRPDGHPMRAAGGGGPGLAGPFLETLAADFAPTRHRIHVTCDPALQLRAAELAPVGMIVREAISNALKHAFPDGRDGDVWVRLAEAGERVTLVIRDNGAGMSDSDSERHAAHGLIEALARQLGGYARLGSANFGGAEVSVVFPHGA
jgi:DNA-binding response OmpR family regulator